MKNKFFPKQQPKFKLEAILKSVMSGLAVGFGANFVAATILWFTAVNNLWLLLGIWAAVSTIAAIIFYYKRFHATDEVNARRIDRLGLEERLVTMVEYDEDASLIAKLQRQDAERALAAIQNSQIKMKIPTGILVSMIVCCVLGVGMTTVNVLTEAGFLPSGDQLFGDIAEDQKTVYVMLSYEVEEGGEIEGDENQLIAQGSDGSTITAVPDDGYMFTRWSDGSRNPTRTDKKVDKDKVVIAEFREIEESEDGDGAGAAGGDKPPDGPPNESETSSGGEKTEAEAGNNEMPPTDEDPSNLATGKWKPNDMIINGEINYRDVLNEYKDHAEELLEDPDSGLTDEEREILKKYLGIV